MILPKRHGNGYSFMSQNERVKKKPKNKQETMVNVFKTFI